MKSRDFIKENNIGLPVKKHMDHEVQMARESCYNAANNAIKLHQLLKNVNEIEGIDGWVAEKISIAADYLRTVREYLEYEQLSQNELKLGEDASAGATGAASVGGIVAPLFQPRRTIKRKKK